MRSSLNGSPAQYKIPGTGPMIVPLVTDFINRQSTAGLTEPGEVNAPARQQNNPPTSNGQVVGSNTVFSAPPVINSERFTTQPPQIINSSP